MKRDPYITQSLCPVCLKILPAQHIERERRVYLEKACPQHGSFTTLVWDGPPAIELFYQNRSAVTRLPGWRSVDQGCPLDCGLCVAHRQYGCIVLLEITRRCNLNCAVCFAGAGPGSSVDPALAQIDQWYTTAKNSGPGVIIQISGGEPTLRDDLPEIVALGRARGFEFIQLNTNGLRLAAEPDFVKKLAEAGLSSVYLQFDGTRDEIYRAIRGRDLFTIKQAAIENCAQNQIGVVLVPTLVPPVNSGDIGNILRFALARSPQIRGVHFQPLSYFGRFPLTPPEKARFTLPELMRGIESQSAGLFKASQMQPPNCENALCSFHCNYVILPGGRPQPLSRAAKSSACCPSQSDIDSRIPRTVDYVAKQWRASETAATKFSPGFASHGFQGQPVVPKVSPPETVALSLDQFLELAHHNSFTLSAMAFQDAWNVDLKRVQDCCIHVAAPDNRLIPFCLYNLTNTQGQALYRDRNYAHL
jgi:7,8-dihydro-6-hydroxymethylpterin dimethyltransferase